VRSIAIAAIALLPSWCPDLVLAANHVGSWTPNGHPVCTAIGTQDAARAIPDGQGGCFIVWQDGRAGNSDVYAIRLNREGQVAPGWLVNGNPIGATVVDQIEPQIASDGSGGAWIGWLQAGALHVQHVLADGSLAPGWPANGAAVVSGNDQSYFGMDANAAGVAFAWNSSTGIRVLRMDASGSPAGGWPSDGVVLSSRSSFLRVVAGGTGQVFVGWSEVVPPCVGHGCPPSSTTHAHLSMVDGPDVTNIAGSSGGNTRGDYWIVSDGSGGVIGSHVVGQALFPRRFDPTGATVWSAHLEPSGPGPWASLLAPDGAGGALLAYNSDFTSSDIRAVRIGASGVVSPGWAPEGNLIEEPNPSIVDIAPDSFGGVFVGWNGWRGEPTRADLFAVRLDGAGATAPGWSPEGDIVSDAPNDQELAHMTDSEPGAAIVVWSDARSDAGDIYAQRIVADNPTSVAVALIDANAEPGCVTLRWQITGSDPFAAVVERSTDGTSWHPLGQGQPDGHGVVAYEDRSVTPGRRYGYRLLVSSRDGQEIAGETWVTTPAGVLSLRSMGGIPSLRFEVTLASGSLCRLELFDASGRRIRSRSFAGLGPGAHEVDLGDASDLPAGLVFARLIEGSRSARCKIALFR
jgi:hypothetical protein